MSDKNHILNILKDTGALLEGHFILSSGKHSSKYFQCAKVLQYPEYLTAFSIMIADEYEGQKPDVVISPETITLPIVTIVSQATLAFLS